MSNSNFQWRPNDNGSLTNMRYDLEATKWVKAVKDAKFRSKPTNIKGDLGVIGMFLSIPLLLLFFCLLIPIRIIKEVFGYNIKVFTGDAPTGRILTMTEKFEAERAERNRKYPSKGNRTPEDMTQEKVDDLVAHVRAETAKAYGN